MPQWFSRRCLGTTLWLSCVVVAPVLAQAPAFTHTLPVREHVLDNGLRLLVLNRPVMRALLPRSLRAWARSTRCPVSSVRRTFSST
jgi:hypothetical protein